MALWNSPFSLRISQLGALYNSMHAPSKRHKNKRLQSKAKNELKQFRKGSKWRIRFLGRDKWKCHELWKLLLNNGIWFRIKPISHKEKHDWSRKGKHFL